MSHPELDVIRRREKRAYCESRPWFERNTAGCLVLLFWGFALFLVVSIIIGGGQ